MAVNGSAPSLLVNPQPQQVALSHAPGQVPFAVTVIVYPDCRAAPNDSARLSSELVLSVLVLQQQCAILRQQVAAMQVALAELARPTEVEIVGREDYPYDCPYDRERDGERFSLAIAAVAAVADQIELTATPVAPTSALDALQS